MVDMECCFLAGLRKTAVLATVPGTLNDLTPETRRNLHGIKANGD